MRDEATKLNQKRVIIYARYSTDLQNEKSAEDQVFECKQYAERQGWNVVDIIFDEATSGANEQRQGYREVRRAIEEQACDIILAENIDRLTRDQEHAARLNKEARFYEVEIHTTARGQLDAIQIAFGSTLGQMFLQDIAAKTRRGLSATVRQGKSAGGKSFGYRNQIDERGEKKIGELEIVEEEAAIIRRIFRMYVEGISPLSIAAQLNKERIPAPRSGKSSDKKGGWRQTTINGNRQRGTGILNNELYIAKRVWNRLEYRKNPHLGKKVSRLNPESEWQVVEVPELRIVPMELWQAVKTRQDAQTKVRASKEPTDRNRLGASQKLRRRKHLLSGLLKCGKCGANLTVAGSVEKRYYCSTAKELGKTQCSGFPGLSSDRASEHVLSVLQTQMLTDEAFQRFQRQYIAGLEQARQDSISADKVREKRSSSSKRKRQTC